MLHLQVDSVHVLKLRSEPRAGSDIKSAYVPRHPRGGEHRVVDVIVAHVPVQLGCLHLHAQQQVREVRQVHVRCGEGIKVHTVVRVDGLCVHMMRMMRSDCLIVELI